MKANDSSDLMPRGPQPRIEVEEMVGYSAPLEGRRKLLRLDFNENTIGPSPLVVKALRNISANEISIYPEYNGLKEAYIKSLNQAKTTQIKTSEIGLFNGVDAAINAIFHSYGDRNDNFLTTSPTFGYYTPCAQMQGMRIVEIPYIGETFEFPFEKIKENISQINPKILLICNPNNPTGTRLSPQKLMDLINLNINTLVVVDELYEAFTDDSILPISDFNKTPNLIILRSLSKTAGLAGLRIGFAIGNSNVIDNIKCVTGPYDINSFAVKAALAALEDQQYTNNYIQEVLEAKKWLQVKLQGSNLKYHIDGGNYALIWPKNESLVTEKMLRLKGILVRNMKGKPLISDSLRVSIGTKKQMREFWSQFCKIESI
tara:strand:- start:843 stop:1961 length:1119 start_codon:yes stop_codon:yes gene_type:complete